MTEEEKAEEIANERCKEQMCLGRCNIHKNHHCGYWHYNYECALKGIEYGLTEGRKEKWHDLRKNPDDLPTDKGEYWIKYNDLNEERCEYYDIHYFNPNNPFYKQKWYRLDVIAWCELPKFEED